MLQGVVQTEGFYKGRRVGQEVVAKENACFKPDCLLLGARRGREEGGAGRNRRGLYHADYLASVDQEISDWLF